MNRTNLTKKQGLPWTQRSQGGDLNLQGMTNTTWKGVAGEWLSSDDVLDWICCSATAPLQSNTTISTCTYSFFSIFPAFEQSKQQR
jgi:hypothetical protein